VRILGIDPGLVRTGYGVVEAADNGKLKLIEAGVIKTSAGDGIAVRLKDIYENLSAVIRELGPQVLVLEKIYSHYKHPATAILMGHARGIICLAAGINRIKLVNYPSTKIKKSITGNGHASKQQMQRSVQAVLGLTTRPEPVDVSDAIGIALSYAYLELPLKSSYVVGSR
jgi:crossover junction endodeoxyribonuclease RuvC